jgi:DNA replication and repair protein RecF
MHLSHLVLNDFRNFKRLDLPLGRGLSLFYGENAQGKTNLLEAVSMLATSNSFHAASDREVVNWDALDRIARITAEVERREDEVKVEIVIIDASTAEANGDSAYSSSLQMPDRQRKRIKINGVVKKATDLIGQVTVVLFAPTDLRLVDGSPEDRRRFLDRALCQAHPRYCAALARYRKVITQRSALLKRIRENQEDPRMLEYLDEKLIELANQIIYERQRMIKTLNTHVDGLQTLISGGREGLQIVYRPAFEIDPAWNTLDALEHYRRQLHAARRKEIQQGVCLLGPHRDDLDFVANEVNLLTYGSRGQQRTAALSAKLAELEFMRTTTGEEPILLLDDVFSELDAARREYMLRLALDHEQALVTATDMTGIPDEILTQIHRYSVVAGEITHTHF